MNGRSIALGIAIVGLLLLVGRGGRSRGPEHAMMRPGRSMPGMGRFASPAGGATSAATDDTGVRSATGAAAATPPGCPAITPAVAAAGRQIFNGPGNCFGCHGRDGAGTGMAPALHAHRWLKIDGSFPSIVGLVNGGVPHPVGPYTEAMPPRGGATLSRAQVCAVAAYVFSLSH